jgi:hypothetical protein
MMKHILGGDSIMRFVVAIVVAAVVAASIISFAPRCRPGDLGHIAGSILLGGCGHVR